MQDGPIQVFLSVYDESEATDHELISFFKSTDECCVPSAEFMNLIEKYGLIEGSIRRLYTGPAQPKVKLPIHEAVERVRKIIDPKEPAKAVENVVRYHPLPDGNKRLALLLFIGIRFLDGTAPLCRDFGEVLRKAIEGT